MNHIQKMNLVPENTDMILIVMNMTEHQNKQHQRERNHQIIKVLQKIELIEETPAILDNDMIHHLVRILPGKYTEVAREGMVDVHLVLDMIHLLIMVSQEVRIGVRRTKRGI